jgi:Fe-S cluster assembly ATP-binding protein
MTTPILEVRNLHVAIGEREILKGLDLSVNGGEVHAIMGPNGSGKSTLAHVLAGNPVFTITAGEARYLGKDLLAMPADVRAREGVFLGFQYPVEIPGVRVTEFLRSAMNALRQHRGQETLDFKGFNKALRDKMQLLGMDQAFTKRMVNEGFSGGEKKRHEILQMALLEPKLALLDETDSGLDIDALRVVASGVNSLRRPDNAIVLVTHYQRILGYVEPDIVHVLIDGRIVRSGGKDLALELEAKGYDWLREGLGTRT